MPQSAIILVKEPSEVCIPLLVLFYNSYVASAQLALQSGLTHKGLGLGPTVLGLGFRIWGLGVRV